MANSMIIHGKNQKIGCLYIQTTQISVKNRRKWDCQVWDAGLNSRKRWVIVKWLGRNKYGNKISKTPKWKHLLIKSYRGKLVQTESRAKRLSSESRSKLVCILPSRDRVRGTQIVWAIPRCRQVSLKAKQRIFSDFVIWRVQYFVEKKRLANTEKVKVKVEFWCKNETKNVIFTLFN